MNATKIERYDFASLSVSSVLAEAAKTLGYGFEPALRGTLLEALRKLEIAPLNRDAVEKYKSSKEKNGWYSGTKVWLGMIASLISVVALTWFIDHKFANWDQFSFPNFLVIGLSLGIVVFSIITLWFTFSDDAIIGEGTRYVRNWTVNSLHGYSNFVPEHVLSKALEIKKEVPEAKFLVYDLMEHSETYKRPRRDPDPFLEVVLREERYYIEVWDERDFEKLI